MILSYGWLCCLDIDECKNNSHNCFLSENMVCVDTNGSFFCECQQGYSNASDVCEGIIMRHLSLIPVGVWSFFLPACTFHTDIDECSDVLFNNCSHMCLNNNGSYECVCSFGYSLKSDGKTCEGKQCYYTRIIIIEHLVVFLCYLQYQSD